MGESNNICNLGYNRNRTYSTVLNKSPYVENPRREIFHQILQSSKFPHYRVTLHDTEHKKLQRETTRNGEMVDGEMVK